MEAFFSVLLLYLGLLDLLLLRTIGALLRYLFGLCLSFGFI